MSGPCRADAQRMAGLRRAFSAVRALARAPRTLEELGADIGTTQRTARRYVYALRAAGVDITADYQTRRAPAGVYRLNRRAWLALLDVPKD